MRQSSCDCHDLLGLVLRRTDTATQGSVDARGDTRLGKGDFAGGSGGLGVAINGPSRFAVGGNSDVIVYHGDETVKGRQH